MSKATASAGMSLRMPLHPASIRLLVVSISLGDRITRHQDLLHSLRHPARCAIVVLEGTLSGAWEIISCLYAKTSEQPLGGPAKDKQRSYGQENGDGNDKG